MKREYLLLFSGVESYHRARGVNLSKIFHRDLIGMAIEDSFKQAYEELGRVIPKEIRELRELYNAGGREALEAMLKEERKKSKNRD